MSLKMQFLLPLTSLAMAVSSCGMTEPQPFVDSQSDVLGGPQRILTKQQTRGLILRHFREFSQDMVDKMFCIAYAESNFDAWIESYAGARGLFQIMPVHTLPGEACSAWTPDELWNEDVNAACAYRVYLRQGFDAWDPHYFAQRDASSIHAQKYLSCRRGEIGWGE